jgi:hypothetical protein
MSNDNQIAKEKLSNEIEKDITKLIQFAKQCSLTELMHFIYWLHWTRNIHEFPNVEKKDIPKTKVITSTIEESIKFIISLIIKHGSKTIEFDADKYPILNTDLVKVMLFQGNLINSKYESNVFIELFDVEVSGPRNRYIKIDTTKKETEEATKNFFEYFLRIDLDNHSTKINSKSKYELLSNFENEYAKYGDLFLKEMGITVKQYVVFINSLLTQITDCLESKVDKMAKLKNGNIDVQNSKTFYLFMECLLDEKSKLIAKFGVEYENVIDRLTFDTNLFDESQLRFHLLTRKPIINIEDNIFLSPELLLDSLFTNTHYSLIESKEIKDEYIARKSDGFLDKIVTMANKKGYKEITRELELYEGKNQIGDVDLVMKNDQGHFLLIEAKDHALPLDVYFKDLKKTKAHLKYLKNKWESKVLKRQEHLKEKHSEYSISSDYEYIIVSLHPEIISHYSDLMILSLQEFNVWIEEYESLDTFAELYKEHYTNRVSKFSEEDIEELRKENIILARFAKK